jgi:ribosome-associated protein
MIEKDSVGKGRQQLTAKTISTIINACAETKGKDLVVLDVSKIFSLSDYFVIVSGRSDRQVQGITNKILTMLAQCNVTPFSVEGEEKAHWVLIDFGEIVVHVFYEPVREHFDLEALWNKARRVDIAKEVVPLESSMQAA